MSMNVQSTLTAYGNYHDGYNAGKVKETQGSEKTSKKETFISNGEKQLSKSAQDMLKTLRNSRSDMDFMVADFDKGDNAKAILSHSNKEFTVIFSSEELEKMASSEKYFAEKMHSVDGAIRMSEEINAQFGFERAFDKTTFTKFGISFNSDGSTTLFAELEKSIAKQKEEIEKNKQQNADEKKTANKKEQSLVTNTKKAILQATTWEGLLEKMNSVDWNTIKVDTKTVGSRFDFKI